MTIFRSRGGFSDLFDTERLHTVWGEKISTKPWEYALWVFYDRVGLSREELARYLHISARSLIRWEQGEEPSIRYQLKLVAALEGMPELLEQQAKDISILSITENKYLTGSEVMGVLQSVGLERNAVEAMAKEVPSVKGLSLKSAFSEYSAKKSPVFAAMMNNVMGEKFGQLQENYKVLKETQLAKRKNIDQRKIIVKKRAKRRRRSAPNACSSGNGGKSDGGESGSDGEPPPGTENAESSQSVGRRRVIRRVIEKLRRWLVSGGLQSNVAGGSDGTV